MTRSFARHAALAVVAAANFIMVAGAVASPRPIAELKLQPQESQPKLTPERPPLFGDFLASGDGAARPGHPPPGEPRVPVKPIRLFGDPVLRMTAQPVTTFDKELRTLVQDLTETMQAAPGRRETTLICGRKKSAELIQ